MSSEEMFKTPPAKSEFVTRKAIVDHRALTRQVHRFQLLLCYWTCRLSSIRSNVDRSSVKSFSGAMKTR